MHTIIFNKNRKINIFKTPQQISNKTSSIYESSMPISMGRTSVSLTDQFTIITVLVTLFKKIVVFSFKECKVKNVYIVIQSAAIAIY